MNGGLRASAHPLQSYNVPGVAGPGQDLSTSPKVLGWRTGCLLRKRPPVARHCGSPRAKLEYYQKRPVEAEARRGLGRGATRLTRLSAPRGYRRSPGFLGNGWVSDRGGWPRAAGGPGSGGGGGQTGVPSPCCPRAGHCISAWRDPGEIVSPRGAGGKPGVCCLFFLSAALDGTRWFRCDGLVTRHVGAAGGSLRNGFVFTLTAATSNGSELLFLPTCRSSFVSLLRTKHGEYRPRARSRKPASPRRDSSPALPQPNLHPIYRRVSATLDPAGDHGFPKSGAPVSLLFFLPLFSPGSFSSLVSSRVGALV